MCASLLPELLCLRRIGLITDLWAALRHCRLVGMLMGLMLVCGSLTNTAHAQLRADSTPYPLMDHRVPPGTWAEWVRIAGRVNGIEFQPVRVELPSEGKVTWFVGSRDDVKESVQVKLAVGQSYRVKLSSNGNASCGCSTYTTFVTMRPSTAASSSSMVNDSGIANVSA